MNHSACGKYGFHQVRTMLRFEIDGDKIQSLEVIELGEKNSRGVQFLKFNKQKNPKLSLRIFLHYKLR